VKILNGHFDGKVVVLDETTDLKPNTKVKIVAPERGDPTGFSADFAILSEHVFEKIGTIHSMPITTLYNRGAIILLPFSFSDHRLQKSGRQLL
jgi:hypothetical protein